LFALLVYYHIEFCYILAEIKLNLNLNWIWIWKKLQTSYYFVFNKAWPNIAIVKF